MISNGKPIRDAIFYPLLWALLWLTPLSCNAEYQAPRNFFGDPDLQGTWTNATLTALQRPDEFDSLAVSVEREREVTQPREDLYEDIDNPNKPGGKLDSGGDVGGYNTFWFDEGDRMARVDGEIRSSLIVYPENGKIPYRTSAYWSMAKKFSQMMFRYDGPEVRPLGEWCIVGFGSTGGPPMLPVLYNNNYQIVQNKDTVMILVEMNHDARIVRMNSQHPPVHVKKWLGDSIGWWEGDTLVVETTNFHPGQSVRAGIRNQLISSDALKVTERITRVSDQGIKYEFSMDDPAVYSEVWRAEMPMRKSTDTIYEYACHKGNYAMRGILAGARLAEEEWRAGGFMETLATWIGDY